MPIEALIQTVGYPLVFLLIAAESTGLPVPGEITVLMAAAAAGAGKGGFNIWLVFLFAAAGAIVGDTIGYWVGKRGGRPLVDKLSGKLWLNPGHIKKAESFFAKHGGKTVFIGRWVSYLRLFTALLAGISRMPYPKFLFYNALSGIVWAAVMSFLGFKFGRHIDKVEHIIKEVGLVIMVLAVLVDVVYLLVRKVLHRGHSRR